MLSHPSAVNSHYSADQFAQHFSDKISRIRQTTAGFHPPDIRQRNVDISLNELRPATVDKVSAIIKRSPAKQCSLDPMPTWLLKECSGVMAPIITAMCNASITQSKFPAAHKSAIVRPLLKKPSLDTADLNSYRPISNLSFVSKVLERIVDSRFTEHANSQSLQFSPFQSAYRKHYSTETALVKVHNDLISAVDQGNVGALALLDLSSAFDTVDHQLLLATLQKRFAVTNSALSWFQSYLAGRTQTVHLHATVSDAIHVDCGVPQGSLLGPKTFIAYVDEMHR